ncbi:hypothetical protein [Mycobacteroides abscessus]|uniref:hypothetical protein n=1 Tax=Mycobacteroides abscessus TaxID=36809 RepID=UPI00078D4C41|nr:hypothetical protein [Mycobacteroides abscessus]AMU64501.1 hypothetical protein A3O04_03820 [Mycobacteroides abscessus]MBE5406083.1 hypothetical protein [Mycobacteroides abscessus]MBE5429203.1 hypothetical protein [Mycobacteroides abscessus]MBE5498249.1 hypothetical protein [Mycobacteroides abscessus]MBN7424565.1 hypothetical protein [Mycobacteroides abscessus subsp. massiliense]
MTGNGEVFHVELAISANHCDSHEAFVIVDAFTEYAATQRWRAENDPNGEFLRALADTADDLRKRIDAQLCDARLRRP